ALETIRRLAARGAELLITVDCAITAVEEVAAARAAGVEVVVTDHHAPRADGRLPDCPIVHPAVCGYPCEELCGTGVAYQEAEAQVAELGERPAFVLAAEDWHPGVIGIVASRVVEHHHRPAILISLDGEVGTGSGRSIPGFDLLGALHAGADHLERYGGHRA